MDQPMLSGLEPKARRALVLLCVASGTGLFLVKQGIDSAWPGFGTPVVQTVLYTMLLAVPALVGLLLNQANDRLPWVAGGVYALVLLPLALHTGNAVVPDLIYTTPAIYFPYCLVVALFTFIVAPFMQAARSGPSFLYYPALFEFAWGNALALVIAQVFTGACWLILQLWQELFAVIGIKFFSELFKQPEFYYPATGLFVGVGAVLGRTQSVAVRTLLNICLMLGRALFPVIGAVALLFLGTLAFNSLDPLWKTGHASMLLLTVVAFAVSLFSAVYQDGLRPASYGPALRLLTNVVLLALPLFIVIAAYAMWLRTRQFGLTEERLWAWLVTLVAALYVLAYAVAVIWRRTPWLSLVGPANAWIALGSILVLLLTQSPLLDFRTIAVRSQIDRALAPGGDPAKLDLLYLRFAGKPGNDALAALLIDPRITSNAGLLASIKEASTTTRRFDARSPVGPSIREDTYTVIPAGLRPPPGLLDAIRDHHRHPTYANSRADCSEAPGSCVLLSTDIGPLGAAAWIEVDGRCWNCLPVYTEDSGGWRFRGNLEVTGLSSSSLLDEIKGLNYTTESPQWKELVVNGNARYHFVPSP